MKDMSILKLRMDKLGRGIRHGLPSDADRRIGFGEIRCNIGDEGKFAVGELSSRREFAVGKNHSFGHRFRVKDGTVCFPRREVFDGDRRKGTSDIS